MAAAQRNDTIKALFGLGLNYSEILEYLAHEYNVIISHRHLKRILNGFGLYRKKYFTDVNEVTLYIQGCLNISSSLHGYRWFHQKAIQDGYVVSQEMIRQLLSVLDPQGVAIRNS